MNKHFQFIKPVLAGIFLATGFASEISAQNRTAAWEEISKTELSGTALRQQLPEAFKAVRIDFDALRQQLASAPAEAAARQTGLELSLPNPDGTSSRFTVWEAPIMAPGLSAKYPDIKTYAGQGVDDRTATLRLDISPAGVHAQVLSAKGAYYIDPYAAGNTSLHIAYQKTALQPSVAPAVCGFQAQADPELKQSMTAARQTRNARLLQNVSNGTEMRTYRLALACTGEYAATKGGTTQGALSAMVTSMNRVNGIYERELAIRMILVENTDTLIFLSGSSDPYSNNNGGTMLGQNQTTVDNRIGTANYDIGHVFSTGGGGIAGLGVPCRANQKARGVTGLPNPTGDAFDVDYVAHEMGHQFGGEHTFNGTSGSCSGNGSSSTSYEPGSGTTIMAYAGICGSHNTAQHSSPYFHTASFDDIVTYTTGSFGNTCPVISPTGNVPPEVGPGDVYYIPYQTPFILRGSATDADGDTLTYCFEQFDLGPFGHPNSPSGNAPIFRSFDPVAVNYRYFPKISSIVNNTNTTGERLPSYERAMHFRLTARDNRALGGGVAYNSSTMTVFAENLGGPFKVTAPNTTVTWQGLETQTVTWDVAGTSQNPIFTSAVHILLSTDGGYTFTDTLAAFVPNTGSYNVTVPNIQTNTARIVVFGAGNIFFDMSDANFSISQVNAAPEEATLDAGVSLFPNPTQGEFNLAVKNAQPGKVTVTVTDMLGRVVALQDLTKSASTLNYSLNLSSQPNGVYFVQVATGNTKTVKQIVKL